MDNILLFTRHFLLSIVEIKKALGAEVFISTKPGQAP